MPRVGLTSKSFGGRLTGGTATGNQNIEPRTELWSGPRAHWALIIFIFLKYFYSTHAHCMYVDNKVSASYGKWQSLGRELSPGTVCAWPPTSNSSEKTHERTGVTGYLKKQHNISSSEKTDSLFWFDMLSQDHQCFPQDLCYQHHDHHPVETCGLFSRGYRKAKRKELLTYSEQVHKACCTAPHVAAGSVGELVTVCFQTHCLDPDLLTVEPRRRLVMRTCDLHIHLIPPCKGSRLCFFAHGFCEYARANCHTWFPRWQT